MSGYREVDAVIIGGGHNALVAAAYLARAGWSVEVLEREDHLGGAVVTEELTLPGYRHDTFSGWHLLLQGSAAFAELGPELAQRGLRYLNTDGLTAATATVDGRVTLLYRDPAHTAAGFSEADGKQYVELINYWKSLSVDVGQLMSAPLESLAAGRSMLAITRQLGVKGALEFGREMAISARHWLEEYFQGPEVSDLLVPWVMHAGLGPDQAGGGFPLLTLAAVMHVVGMPVAEGGSAALIEALGQLISDHGGVTRTAVDVIEVICQPHRGGYRAVGVTVEGGEVLMARRAVIASTTPAQLYGRLLPIHVAPETARREAAAYRFGPGDVQIHLALSEPLRWRDSRLDEAPVINVTGGIDSLTVACAQSTASMLPAVPTFLLGQPHVLDPSRAPAGAGVIWIQLLQQPNNPVADAAGAIAFDRPGWSETVRTAYAERVIGMLRDLTVNLDRAVVGTAVLSPADLEARNINFVGGDPYAGACTLDQSYLWRPLPSYGDHRTPVDRLWMCGAATFPGPGVNGASGRIVAKALLR